MIDLGSVRMDLQMFALVLLVLACVEQSLASCVVDSFTVKDDFDPQRVSTPNSNYHKDSWVQQREDGCIHNSNNWEQPAEVTDSVKLTES